MPLGMKTPTAHVPSWSHTHSSVSKVDPNCAMFLHITTYDVAQLVYVMGVVPEL